MRLTRQLISKITPVSKTHDTPPSPARIAQPKAERSLLDLIAALRTPGVTGESIAKSIASRSANLDTLGAKDIGDELNAIASTLYDLYIAFDSLAYEYECARYDTFDAAAGASAGATVPLPDCEALPPAVNEQIKRKVERDNATPHTILGPGGDFVKPLYA